MVIFRSVELSELGAFSNIGDAQTARAYRTYLSDSLEAGETSPDRWFAAIDEDGDIVGRIVFWGLPGSAEVSLDVFSLPWATEKGAAFAPDFLRTALDSLGAAGIAAVEYEHHEPDPDAHTPARLIETLKAAGFRHARRTVRFELSPIVPKPTARGLAFAGEADGLSADDFAQAIARCATVGDDEGVTRRQADEDVGRAAQRFVDSTRAMRGGSALWRIARAADDVVGVILPTANDGGPVLNYVGVVPEHRGRRLVDDLLAEAARLQAEAGAQRMRADSDEANTRMHAAFTRAGWHEFGRRTTYRLDLSVRSATST